jgi:hypothetical protein
MPNVLPSATSNGTDAVSTTFYLTPSISPLAALYFRANTYGNHGVRFAFLVVATRGVFHATTND